MTEPDGAKAGKNLMACWKAIIAAFVFVLTGALFPSKAGAELALGLGQDFIHARDTQALLLRYDYRPLRLGAYSMAWYRSDTLTGALGADFNLGYSIVDVNLGGVYLPEVMHLSNGKRVFRWLDDKNNAGWNFLAVSYGF